MFNSLLWGRKRGHFFVLVTFSTLKGPQPLFSLTKRTPGGCANCSPWGLSGRFVYWQTG